MKLVGWGGGRLDMGKWGMREPQTGGLGERGPLKWWWWGGA